MAPRHATVLRGIIRCLVPTQAGSAQVRYENLAALMRPVESARMIPERLGPDAWARLVHPLGGRGFACCRPRSRSFAEFDVPFDPLVRTRDVVDDDARVLMMDVFDSA